MLFVLASLIPYWLPLANLSYLHHWIGAQTFTGADTVQPRTPASDRDFWFFKSKFLLHVVRYVWFFTKKPKYSILNHLSVTWMEFGVVKYGMHGRMPWRFQRRMKCWVNQCWVEGWMDEEVLVKGLFVLHYFMLQQTCSGLVGASSVIYVLSERWKSPLTYYELEDKFKQK